ncbi:hypothetical protein NDU88_007431 [Pleurodeles waltl]|uniref:Uncharacterized protein n=1 Tax=Pleurodeles waltl TaxID=8319 RepID=A0AAV7VQH7_PLEWA|nr:hypothetical protein NDU88_007431 [Pleurodeles waltl]
MGGAWPGDVLLGLARERPRVKAVSRLEVRCGHPLPVFSCLLSAPQLLDSAAGTLAGESEGRHRWVHRPAGSSGVRVQTPMTWAGRWGYFGALFRHVA